MLEVVSILIEIQKDKAKRVSREFQRDSIMKKKKHSILYEKIISYPCIEY